MSQTKLARAIEIAQELLDGNGDNPAYFAAWRKTQAQWQRLHDAGKYDEGLNQAQKRIRKCYVECCDWAEAKEPFGGGPWSIQAGEFRRYLAEIE